MPDTHTDLHAKPHTTPTHSADDHTHAPREPFERVELGEVQELETPTPPQTHADSIPTHEQDTHDTEAHTQTHADSIPTHEQDTRDTHEQTQEHDTHETHATDTHAPKNEQNEQKPHSADPHTQPHENPAQKDQLDTPTPPLLTPTPPSLPNQTDDEKLEAFKKELEKAIANNEGVIANTHYTLQGIAELLNISADIFRFYRYYGESVKLTSDQFHNLQANLEAITTYINQTLTQISNTHKSNLELFNTTEALLDEAKLLSAQSSADVKKVQKALEALQDLQATLTKLETTKAEIHAQLELATQIKAQIEAIVPNILNEVKTELLGDKEQYERELEAHKAQALHDITHKLQEFTTSAKNIEDLLTQNEQAQNDLETTLQTHTQELEASKLAALQDLEAKKQAIKQELDEIIQNAGGAMPESTPTEATEAIKNAKLEALKELEAQKAQILATLTQESQNHTQELETKRDEILAEIEANKPQNTQATAHTLAQHELGLYLL